MIILSKYGEKSKDAAAVTTELVPGQLVEGESGTMFEYSNTPWRIGRELSMHEMKNAAGEVVRGRNGERYYFIDDWEFFKQV